MESSGDAPVIDSLELRFQERFGLLKGTSEFVKPLGPAT